MKTKTGLLNTSTPFIPAFLFILILLLISLEAKGQLMENASWVIPPTYEYYQYQRWYRHDERDYPFIYLAKENETLQFNLKDNNVKIHSFAFDNQIIVDEKDFFLIGKKGGKKIIYDSKRDEVKQTEYQSLHCFYQYNGIICKGKKEGSDTTYYVSLQDESDYFFKTTQSLDYQAVADRIALISKSENEINIFDFQGNLISTIKKNIVIKENYAFSFPKPPFFHFALKGQYTSEGIISRDGEVLTEYYVDSASPKLIGKYYAINKDNIFNSNGDKIDSSTFLPTALDKVLVKAYCNNAYHPVLHTIKFLHNGRTIPCEIEDFQVNSKSKIIRIKRQNKDLTEYYNDKGNLLIKTDERVEIIELKEKVYSIKKNGLYKIVDDFGKQILPNSFKESKQGFIHYFGDYLVLSDAEDGLLLFDKKWRQIFQHTDARNLLNIIGGYVIFQDKKEKVRMLPLKNKPYLPFQFSDIDGGGYFAEGNDRFLTICDDGECYLMDMKKNKIYPERFDYLLLINENHLLARKNGLYGILKIDF